ncbi:putative zinc-binding metallopeptidase [Acaryochloris sp. CCMEE 5410]|uniref:zinc-binding metallopeptidase family protein n=1 Tax=Acaryochloris sp. CCMEE 5410 TaxID=310037 RepID=UPI00024848AE|nr:putative zinc-binding metallopeptidase [Acaryochloris sp. CCMEE 5410]KAI9132250.1 putative zinc-binding metallopeptidase [Acaryochloris sp. CCMEE 5410]
MKTYTCICGNTLFFENSRCMQCQRPVGWCPGCDRITTLLDLGNHHYQCGYTDCQTLLTQCHNYRVHQVCNRCIPTSEVESAQSLCDYCQYTDTIPDLSISGNKQRWYDLEVAKRRLLYTLDVLNLPFGHADFDVPLSFDFKGDVILKDALWRTLGKGKRVFTGHADGKITINIREADDEVREQLRVDLNEAQRTLIGHFHHEIGHYYWQLLVKNIWLNHFKDLFGDPSSPSYSEAMDQYYANGPSKDWQQQYVSAYATMHPWEDFAETFATYLDMVSVLHTTRHHQRGAATRYVQTAEFDDMIAAYRQLGILLNELNRTLGLIDFIPEVFTPFIINKLRFIHQLVRSTQSRQVGHSKIA